jgi:GTP cyclohydrolase II
MIRGPVICTVRHITQRNAIGAHSGSYSIYTGLAVAAALLNPEYVPNLKLTQPVFKIGPHPSWSNPKKIACIDPFGHIVTSAYAKYLDKGFDIRPTIAVTKAHIDLPECREAIEAGRIIPDGKILLASGQSICSKAAIEPVWYLPEVARRFGCTEAVLRQSIFRMTNGMYPELITRPDIKIFLPPIGGLTIYMWGDPDTIPDEDIELTCRVHDECNGSDVFGSDICTCRPYLTHAIEECIKTAQRGGCGVVIYFRKEGRSLGEVTKYLVYNTRKRQEGGDSAANYFNCTEIVAGVQDTRFQALMPDALHWLGVTKIHNFISMSDMKYNAIVSTGIKIENRVEIPKELVPADAQVEITAKVFHGYNAGKAYQGIDENELKKTKGRDYAYNTVDDGANVVKE